MRRDICADAEKRGRQDRLEKPAGEIRNLIRGMLPWPGAFTFS